eukprot:Macronucleus_6831.p1 GENE.Macronucleus_6831~~Macronucleus_6831.p1  ORF type:complete len:147 (+),score=27.49 Macronucleus_6831:1-441(+)
MFHPNIYTDGSICLDILQHAWSPVYDVSSILTSIQSLLTDPNVNSPANNTAAVMYSQNYQEYCSRVRQCVEQSQQDVDDDDEDDANANEQEEDAAAEGGENEQSHASAAAASHSQPVAAAAANDEESKQEEGDSEDEGTMNVDQID